MQTAPKDLINEILALSNANLLLRDEILSLRAQVERLELASEIPSKKQHQPPPMEKL